MLHVIALVTAAMQWHKWDTLQYYLDTFYITEVLQNGTLLDKIWYVYVCIGHFIIF